MAREELLDLVEKLCEDGQLHEFSEAQTKQSVVLQILNCLGWNIFDMKEVCPEYSVGQDRVDFALKYNNKNKVFIEVKRVDENLEQYQEQLLKYSFKEGVELAVLTNGVSWWFYLPLREGNWEQRKFYTADIYEQNPREVVQKFEDFLSRENVISGRARNNAEKIYSSKQKKLLVEETIPKAWNRIVGEPDELLIELLAETVEKLCGYKPEDETVKQFLKDFSPFITAVDTGRELARADQESRGRRTGKSLAKDRLKDYTGKHIKSLIFKGKRYSVKNWKDAWLKMCELMLFAHRSEFDKVLTLRGRKRPYFSRHSGDLREPVKIKGTNIYVETNLSANNIVSLLEKIIQLFGYSVADIAFELENR